MPYVDGDWDYTDASQWYDTGGNSMGDKRIDSSDELTADDVVDNHETTRLIAEYDGDTLSIYFGQMGHAGQRYFTPKALLGSAAE